MASVSLSADSMGFLAPKTEVAEVAGNIFGLKRLRLSIDRCTCHWQSLPLVDEDVFFIDHHEIPAHWWFHPRMICAKYVCVCTRNYIYIYNYIYTFTWIHIVSCTIGNIYIALPPILCL